MDGLVINDIEEVNENTSLKGVFLVILHADKIPPHLGICVSGHFFSITVYGNETLTQDILIRGLNIKKTAAVFSKLKLSFPEEELFSFTKNIFNSYPCVDEHTSCLDPIKEWAGKLFSIDTSNFKTIHHLFSALREKKVLLESYAFNLPVSPTHSYEISDYSIDEVQARINQLNL